MKAATGAITGQTFNSQKGRRGLAEPAGEALVPFIMNSFVCICAGVDNSGEYHLSRKFDGTNIEHRTSNSEYLRLYRFSDSFDVSRSAGFSVRCSTFRNERKNPNLLMLQITKLNVPPPYPATATHPAGNRGVRLCEP